MKLRSRVLAVLACSTVALAPPAAHADDISNNLDSSIDAVAEAMPLTIGGADGTTHLYVSPTDGDGKSGCNLTGSTTLGVAITSSDAAVATVGPGSITFRSCGDTPVLTVKPLSVGTTTISITETSNTTGRSFNLAPATFLVNVAAPERVNTAPTVLVSGVTGGVAYNKGAVPPAICLVDDAEDGESSFPAILSAVSGPYAEDGIGSQTANCSYTDAGGLVVSGSETYSIVDPTAPTVAPVLDAPEADGANGWYRGDVTLSWIVNEPESPGSLAKIGCEDQAITADQVETTYSCEASSAGGTSGPQVVKIKRDATAPVDVSFVDGPTNGGWYFPNSVPAAPTCTATDETSGLAGCTVNGYSNALGTHTLSATATDSAGNVTTVNGATYTVRKLQLNGFFAPVDLSGTYNTVKNGSTVPLKFTVFDQGVKQTGTDVVKGFTVTPVNCTTGAEDAIEELATTGGTSLRYDATAGQFIQNWKTPTMAGKCYTVTMTTVDDSTIAAKFKLK